MHVHGHEGDGAAAPAENHPNLANAKAEPSDTAADELVRFSVAVPEGLLRAFDAQTARRGDTVNRSEALRDLMREIGRAHV